MADNSLPDNSQASRITPIRPATQWRSLNSSAAFSSEFTNTHDADSLVASIEPFRVSNRDDLNENDMLDDEASRGLFGGLLQHLSQEAQKEVDDERSETRNVSDHSVSQRRPTKRLRHEDYTVSWICALPEEMVAAKAMLDEVHAPLPNPVGDYNVYQLGSIGVNNVVITALRSGVYGTSSATATAVCLRTTYPNSDIAPLLVGIGGGVPRPDTDDVRLGDVVIGTPTSEHQAVVQHDYGKITSEGKIDAKGALNKPSETMLNALTHFRSDLALKPSKFPEYLRIAAKKADHGSKAIKPSELASKAVKNLESISKAVTTFPLLASAYARPSSETDILLGPECDHLPGGTTCERCPVRLPRKTEDPMLHFGCIASGNQVIKHASTRDRIAGSHVLCFEMEAAGILDYVPVLVIRGICDYCDASKNKDWQRYAALAAAATAKEILSFIPFYEWRHPKDGNTFKARIKEQQVEVRQHLLRALDFEYSSTRQATVKQAHSQTCQWLLQQPQIIDWTTPESHSRHHGLLWMKGKPGAGKSTAMKFLVEQAETSFQDSNVAVVSFFFSARGAHLARSIAGMYRAILGQIFRRMPFLQSLLEAQKPEHVPVEVFTWTLNGLQELFTKVIKSLDTMHLMCYIDALDECPEDQIRDMIDHLEKVTELAQANHLHVCFASRHYPHISIKFGCEFSLELQRGHAQDIVSYLEAELILGRDDLAAKLRRKASEKSGSVFLWIVLVVRILKREYDRGGIHKLFGLLDKIPNEVDELFRDILTRDEENLPQLVAIIRWVLYARRPMTPQELYQALLSTETASIELNFYQESQLRSRDMELYLLSSSKGLMETTKSEQPTVQFIHETVREFLLQPGVLTGLWDGFEGISGGTSHEMLAHHCLRDVATYGVLLAIENSSDFEQQGVRLRRYLESYVLDNHFYHAEEAERLGRPQHDYLLRLAEVLWVIGDIRLQGSPSDSASSNDRLDRWINYADYLEDPQERLGYSLSFSVETEHLFKRWLKMFVKQEDSAGIDRILVTLVCIDNWLSFQKLVLSYNHVRGKRTLNSFMRPAFDLMAALLLTRPRRYNEKITPILDCLTQRSSDKATLREALHLAAYSCNHAVMRELISQGAEVDAQTDDGSTALHLLILSQQKAVSGFVPEDYQDPILHRNSPRKPSSGIRRVMQHVLTRTLADFQKPVLDSFWVNLTRTNPSSEDDDRLSGRQRSTRCIELLFRSGTNASIEDLWGRTPLQLARSCGLEGFETIVSRFTKDVLANDEVNRRIWRNSHAVD